jgi:TRAP-type C4-dicarboxylate transport system permease small subunit
MSDPRPRGIVARLGVATALVGGVALIGVALLTAVSVGRRWLFSNPVPGDFELVSLGSGFAVLGFLALGTLMRTNIFVDSLTAWLPARANAALDAFWMLVWLGVVALLAERMAVGALETWRSGTTTMVLSLPTWWAVAWGSLAFAATTLAAAYWALRLARGRR